MGNSLSLLADPINFAACLQVQIVWLRLLIGVVGTHFTQDGKLWTTLNISKTLAGVGE